MNRFSELVGLFAGMALFLGTLIAAQAYVSHHGADIRAEIEEAADEGR